MSGIRKFDHPSPGLPPSLAAFWHVAPLCGVGGRAFRKPWDFPVTVAIPHLDTLEALQTCIAVLRAQTISPFIIVVDTGSPPPVVEALEAMRANDLEVHFIRAHGWRHSSEPVAAALDLAQVLCRTDKLVHTHADCFLRSRSVLADLVAQCGPESPVVGYRMSPRDWATDEWKWMVGHTLTALHMPTIKRAGATWDMGRMHEFGYEWRNQGGWPDTETAFNHILRGAGITPTFIGDDRNGERQTDERIDHVRSYAGSKIHDPSYHGKASPWMREAISDAQEMLSYAGS